MTRKLTRGECDNYMKTVVRELMVLNVGNKDLRVLHPNRPQSPEKMGRVKRHRRYPERHAQP